jgi:hypothetical protein
VLCQLLLHVRLGWAGLGAVALVGLSALLRWSRHDHIIKRLLPVILEKEARLNLARHGEYRRVWADASGVTVADATYINLVPWERLTLVDTDRHVIIGSAVYSVAIPRHVGQPLAELVGFARGRGVG